jgi:hypothetical protein
MASSAAGHGRRRYDRCSFGTGMLFTHLISMHFNHTWTLNIVRGSFPSVVDYDLQRSPEVAHLPVYHYSVSLFLSPCIYTCILLWTLIPRVWAYLYGLLLFVSGANGLRVRVAIWLLRRTKTTPTTTSEILQNSKMNHVLP